VIQVTAADPAALIDGDPADCVVLSESYPLSSRVRNGGTLARATCSD
jgi:hypothetical protein